MSKLAIVNLIVAVLLVAVFILQRRWGLLLFELVVVAATCVAVAMNRGGKAKSVSAR